MFDTVKCAITKYIFLINNTCHFTIAYICSDLLSFYLTPMFQAELAMLEAGILEDLNVIDLFDWNPEPFPFVDV